MIKSNEHVVTAWCERCRGPGWSNRLVWVLLREDGTCNTCTLRRALPTETEPVPDGTEKPLPAIAHCPRCGTHNDTTTAITRWTCRRCGNTWGRRSTETEEDSHGE